MAILGDKKIWANITQPIRAIVVVGALASLVVVAPLLFLLVVMRLESHTLGLGAVFFYVVFIPLVIAQAWFDLRKA